MVKIAKKYKSMADSITLCAILHPDLGKAGDYGKKNYIENTLKNGKRNAKRYHLLEIVN